MPPISKLEAAERNLREAIILFFQKRDPVAIHTLAAASQQVLRDLAMAVMPEYIGFLHDHPGLRQDLSTEWKRLLNEPRNFFKHADKDVSALIDFDEILNEILLIDAVAIRAQVTTEPHLESSVYAAWFELKYPIAQGAFPGNAVLFHCRERNIEPDDFPEFAKLCQIG